MEEIFSKSQSTTDPAFICDGAWLLRSSACAGEPFYGELDGKRYCVFHFPDDEKVSEFRAALHRKLHEKDYNFRGFWFPDTAAFPGVEFAKEASFIDAVFTCHAEFYRATFLASAYFNGATFKKDGNFDQATFKSGVNFGSAVFGKAAKFLYANFTGEVDFTGAVFEGRVSFLGATFGDHVRFGAEPWKVCELHSIDLQFARIEKPDHVYFHTLTASPSWFVNVDARKFNFVNVDWDWLSVPEEIRGLKRREVPSPHRLLSIACRHLAVNAEESHRYEEASKFRYMAMDTRRLEYWHGFDFRKLSWWYWAASGYGERVWRALMMLIGIMLLFATLYTQVGFARWEPRIASESDLTTAKRDEVGTPLPSARAFTYSAAVMTFQRPEPKPATTAAHAIVILETILGPVQAALLALAIRRKFMR